VDDLQADFKDVTASHIMGLFAQMLRKLVKHIQQRREDDASRQLEESDSRVAKVRADAA
jgi:AraC-like DNA-binding protein